MDEHEHRTLLSVQTTISVDVGDAPPASIFIRPGGYRDDKRHAALAIRHDDTFVYLAGTPEELRAWADHIGALADELDDDSADVEEVAF